VGIPLRTGVHRSSVKPKGLGGFFSCLVVESFFFIRVKDKRQKRNQKEQNLINQNPVTLFYSSNKNTSSMAIPNTLEISYASFNEGLYLPFSRNTIVSLLTFTFMARSCCVRSKRALNSLILFFMTCPSVIDNCPGKKKYETYCNQTIRKQKSRFKVKKFMYFNIKKNQPDK